MKVFQTSHVDGTWAAGAVLSQKAWDNLVFNVGLLGLLFKLAHDFM